MSERPAKRTVRFLIVPDHGGRTRSFRASVGLLRVLGALGVGVAVGLVIIAGTWWQLARRAAMVPGLEHEVERLDSELDRVADLERQLAVIEDRYARIRDLFGSTESSEESDVWLPPATISRRATGAARAERGSTRPTSWPLTERGFITQGLLAGTAQDHLGLDIAVPTDSYVRAAGGGVIVDVGEDPVYGRFVVIDHGDGYSSLYAHMARTLVERGARVRQNEIIALSGSTGRSTAPHLHFEILLNGEAVDPLEMVQQPS